MRKYRIDPRKLEVLRGQIIVSLGHDIAWYRLSENAGLSTNTLSNLLNGRSSGRAKTVRALINYARSVGVDARESDLLSESEVLEEL